MTDPEPCPACSVTLTDACVQGVPAPLCGLCKLMPAGEVENYMRRWEVQHTLQDLEDLWR
jgi:hypothetical protein